MLSKIYTASLRGMEAVAVHVETDISNGLPMFSIVGLADTGVKEARERIRSALMNTGFQMPLGRIVINMSPANLPKKGTHLDLPMAMGILGETRQVLTEKLEEYAFIGELSLDGSLQRVNGILPMLMRLRKEGIRKAVIPKNNRKEASLLGDMEIYGAESLLDVVKHFNLEKAMVPLGKDKGTEAPEDAKVTQELDFVEVKGQEYAKRAIVIAAAGGHGILMTGSPSTGKTMLAQRVPGILPPMDYEEVLEVTQIYSVAGLLDDDRPYIATRPFRNPHHSITPAGLIGGGNIPMPGEVTLADKGVLFLDELAEFESSTIDLLRQPLEERSIRHARMGESFEYPADFLLVAATNPCRCGYYGDSEHQCTCTAGEILRYRGKISGPILDRIDLHITLLNVPYEELTEGPSMSSAEMKDQVDRARRLQKERFRGSRIRWNSRMNNRMIEKYVTFDSEARRGLAQIYRGYQMNPRTFQKLKKVARTIADLEGSELVRWEHVAEAVQYRDMTGR